MAEIKTDDVIDIYDEARKLHPGQNLSWRMNRVSLGFTRQLRNASGQCIWQPSEQPNRPSTLLFLPVIVDETLSGFELKIFAKASKERPKWVN